MVQWSEEDAGRYIKRAESDKSASDELYREAVDLVFPDRENWTRAQEGQSKPGKAWDGQPQVSVIRAANRLSSDWTPQFQKWLEIGLGPAATHMPDAAFKEATGRTKDDMKAQLEAVTAVVQAIYHGPGFATASNELYIDWYFGQGGMQITPAEDMSTGPVDFQAMPLSHFYAYEGKKGQLDRWFFWHHKRPDVIEEEWPDAELTAELRALIQNKQTKTVKLVSCCYWDRDDKVYRYEVFFVGGEGAKRIVERENPNTSPFVTPRHSKLAAENRGRGPVIFALPDIRTANKIVELTLRAAAIAVAGVYTAKDDGVLSPITIKPLGVIKVRSTGGPNGASLERLDTPQRIDFGELLLEKLHENIKKVLGDQSLPPEFGPVRSATEFVQRARELISDQAGGLGRLFGEFIVPATQRIIDILERQQLLPTEGLKIDGFLVEVRMTSPLAKSESLAEVENIVSFIEVLRLLGGDEMVAYEMNLAEVSGHLGDLLSVSPSVRNTAETKKGLVKSGAQLLAVQQGGDPDVAGQTVDALQEAAE